MAGAVERSRQPAGRWQALAGGLTAQRGGLRVYQWLWILACVLGALAVTLPRVLSQPIIYTSSATLQIDVNERYSELYTAGEPDTDYAAVEFIAAERLRARFPDLGSPQLGMRFEPQPDGRILVTAVGRNPAEAAELADAAAETLLRSIRAAGGREILRQLLGWEMVSALDGTEPATEFQGHLRELIRTSAFPLNRPIEPAPESLTIDQLAAEELSDLTRALELREEEISRSNLPQVNRDLAAAADPQTVEFLQREQQRLVAALQATRAAIDYLYRERAAVLALDAPSDAYQSARAVPPDAPVDRRVALFAGLAVLAGLAFGLGGVAVDRSAGVLPKLRELWSYRELMRNLVLRDLRARYKGSALGYLWTQLAPLMLMLVFWLVFSIFMPTSIAMFPVFLIVALLPWNFCAEAVMGGTRSVIDNAHLIKKVFFPREVLPLVAVFSSLLNFLLSLPMLFLVMAAVQWLYEPLSGLNFSWTFAYLPVLIIIQIIFLAGVALLLSATAVFFRDTVHLVGILVQLWFFLTPIIYSFDAVNPTVARVMRWINPMASLVEFYRGILYGNPVPVGLIPTPGLPALGSVLRVLVTSLLILAFGYWIFQRRSGRFGEEI